MSIPQDLVKECLDSCNAVYSPDINVVPGGGGFTLLTNSTLDSLDIQDNINGCFARAYIDSSHRIIISYEGSFPFVPTDYGLGSTEADGSLILGLAPEALGDAVDFAENVKLAAIEQGYGSYPIYVTGHSLGGTEAEWVAYQSSIGKLYSAPSGVGAAFTISGGVTFGATGLPGYLSPGGNSDFINYVESLDPVGNFGKDSVSKITPLLLGSHFGTVQEISSGSILSDVGSLASDIFHFHQLQVYASDLGYNDKAFSPVSIATNATVAVQEPAPNTNLAPIIAENITPSTTQSFTIVSSPTVSESAGQITFTINESGALSQDLTVYVSTEQNWLGSGDYNTATPGSHVSTNYYYYGLSNIPVKFNATSASSSTQHISVAIYQDGLTTGSETFGFEVQDQNLDPMPLASTSFTIVNQASTTPAPAIQSITPSLGSGSSVNAGKAVTFTVTFSAPVTVNQAGGPPFLTLNDNRTASYTGGTGTTALTFVYNVNAGDQTSNLQVTGLSIPNGSWIESLDGTAASTSGATESTGIQVNTTAPIVTITNSGGQVGSASQTIYGTVDAADAGITVTVYDGANLIGTATAGSNGSWAANVTLSVQGPNTIVAKATNSAGNTGVSNQVPYNLSTASYSLSPQNPTAYENQGSLVFTLTRTGDTSAKTVFVQTNDNGTPNPNNKYFNEQNLVAVAFQQYASSATFAIPINDIYATSGSQTFGVSIYPTLSASGTLLASTAFTIVDNYTSSGQLTGNITANATRTGTTTVSTPVYIYNSATLTNNGVIDINSGGSFGGDNAGGIVYNATGSTINIDTADTSASTIDVTYVTNNGTLNASPGAGNVATVWTTNGAISDTATINVLSGTLNLHMFGASSTANLNASGISVASSAALEFSGAGTFTIAGGSYNIAGTTLIGDSTYSANVVFGAGTAVNAGGNWVLNGSLDFSAATLSGTFSSLNIGSNAYSLNFGLNSTTINNLTSSVFNIHDSGTVTLSGAITSDAQWLGGGTIVNQGIISAPAGLAPMALVSNETLINYGVVNGYTCWDLTDTINNQAGGVLNLTSYETSGLVNNAGLINYVGSQPGYSAIYGILNNTGTVQFSQATGWTFEKGGSSNASGFNIADGLTVTFAGGTGAGTFDITGGAFTGGGNLLILSGSEVKFTASTEVDLAFHNDGTIEIAGGTLTLEQALTGSGTVQMDAGTSLALAAPQGFTNTISGFQAGDTIDLLGTIATSASINGSDQLVITDAGVNIATLQMTGVYPGAGLQFLAASDGAGGTKITLGAPAAPSISAGAIATFADNVTPVAATLDSGLTLVSGGNNTLAGATVAIGPGFMAGDVLAATTTGTSIAASYNASVGVLSLSGADSLADYQSVLQSVTFDSSSNAQNNGSDTMRTIDWTVTDGTQTSATANSAVLIGDAAPVLTAGAASTFEVGVSAPVSLDSSLTVSDIDNTTLSGATVSIGYGFNAGDVLGVTVSGTAIAVASNTGGVLTLTGADTLANYQTVLRSVTFSTNDATSSGRVIVWSVNDGSRSSALTDSTVAVTYTPATPPILSIASAALQSNQTTVSLSGTIDTADAGLTVSIDDGSTVLGTATPNASGAWSSTGTVSAHGVHTLTAQATNAAGTGVSNTVVDLVGASTSLSGGGQWILFSGSGDTVSLSSTAGNWDTVTGSNGSVNLTSAQVSVIGGGDVISFASGSGDAASLYNTAGSWDFINGSSGTVYLTNAQTSVAGGGDTINFLGSSGNAASLYNTAGNWDYINGSGGTVYLTNAQTSVAGGGDTINFLGSPGNAASLYNTAGNWDYINGSSGTVYLTNAQTSVAGGGDTIDYLGSSGNAASLYNTAGNWDYINGSGGTVYLTNAQTSVAGGGDTINFLGSSGNAASLYNTAGNWDYINGSGGTVYLTNAQTSVAGGGDTVNFLGSSGNAASLYNTAGNWDYINGSGGTVYLTNAQTSVAGGGDTIDFLGSSGNAASLYNTAGTADTINGSNGSIYLTGAQASVTGNSNTLNFLGTGNTASVSGSSDAFVFQAAFGQDSINGFASSDTMQLAASDFANWSALLGHMTQSGSNTLITLDASDKITLTNVAMSSLQASQFHFQ